MSGAPTCELSQEMRFAVVMYGGVSLAIYINGVSQELLHLVRSTAPVGTDAEGHVVALPEEELSSTERIYRRLGQMLTRDPDARLKAADVAQPVHGKPHSIRTRFVIDVISGTSAGGINGIFLAKALANAQDMRQLSNLWVKEGDIALLLNDRASVPPGLAPQEPPASLLNSQRMYVKLLEAFDAMGKETPGVRPICAREIDLFVPTTDIEGLTMPLRLSDKLVDERRHRSVFRFQCRRDDQGNAARNDFSFTNNPFLAFAARCSSSFPFAFEPMRLADLDTMLHRFADHRRNGSDSDGWKAFYADYLRAAEHGRADTPFPQRSFGDGGYLDNKPFSYAIDTLLQRQADVPLDRKLIYVEPSPEHLEERPKSRPAGEKPNVLENVTAALVSLPRYETIRQDLERVLERNRLIERVQRIAQRLEDDVRNTQGYEQISGAEWARLDLQVMIDYHGVAYGSYHRLKVAEATDELARMIAAAAGFDLESDDFLAVRYLVRAWRGAKYITYFPKRGAAGADKNRPTLNRFLINFDLNYRIRRLNLVRTKLDLIACMDKNAKTLLADIGMDVQEIESRQQGFVRSLVWIKRRLNEASAVLQRTRQALWAPPDRNPIAPLVAELALGPDELKKILEAPTDESRCEQAGALLAATLPNGERRGTRLRKLARKLARRLRKAMKEASALSVAALDPDLVPDEAEPAAVLARRSLFHYYWNFDSYDMVTLPVLHSLQTGELDTVEIFRISPEDATSIIDERRTGRRKLAGTALGHFGAFLDQVWRQNDILWGRLDGAERIITALLPRQDDEIERKQLIREAHLAIIEDEVRPQERTLLKELLAKAIAENPARNPSETKLRELVEKTFAGPLDKQIDKVLTSCLTADQYLDYLTQTYDVDRRLAPRQTVESLSRATRIVGGMLEQVAEEYRINASPMRWLPRLGQIFWGLVTVAVPGSLPELIFQHWLRLLYLFEALLIVGGVLATSGAIQDFGWDALKITLAVHFAVWLLRDFMLGNSRRLRIARVALLVAAVAAGSLLLLEMQRWVPLLRDDLSLLWQQARDICVTCWRGRTFPRGVAALAPLWGRIAGGASLIMALGVMATGLTMRWMRRKAPVPAAVSSSPLLELELAASLDEARLLIEAAGRDRLKAEVSLDFGVIAFYSTVLLFSSRLLAGTGLPFAEWLGLAAGICTLAGATLDVRENFATRKLLETGDITQESLSELRAATKSKWFLLSVAFGLLVALFVAKPGLVSSAAAVVFGSASLIGISAILSGRWRLLKATLVLMGIGLVGAAVILVAAPDLLGGIGP